MGLTEPWSAKHKRVTRTASGGVSFSLSNSYAQPLTHRELVDLTAARGDRALLDEFHNHDLGYTPNGGSQDLREEIAKLYGPAITADHVIIFSGAQAALGTAANAISSACHSIVFTPGYQSVVEAPSHAGSRVTQIVRRPENSWQIDLREVEAAIESDTKYIVVNEPYNPAGTLMSRALQKQLVKLADRHGIYLLSDEIYRFLEHDAAYRLPAMVDTYSRGISLSGMSKPWGGCGITIGWLAFQDMTIKQSLLDAQYFGTACPGRASELQALMVLRASDSILRKNMTIIHRNLALLDNFMERHKDVFEWVRPQAGAIAFLRFKGPLSSEELGRQLADAGISVKPAYCFASSISSSNDYFRVGYGEEKMPAALEALNGFVQDRKHLWQRSSL